MELEVETTDGEPKISSGKFMQHVLFQLNEKTFAACRNTETDISEKIVRTPECFHFLSPANIKSRCILNIYCPTRSTCA